MATDATEQITLHVTADAARAFLNASPQERLKLEALVSLQLLGELHPRRDLDAIIAEMSQQAQERGLTPEILEDLLHDSSSD